MVINAGRELLWAEPASAIDISRGAESAMAESNLQASQQEEDLKKINTFISGSVLGTPGSVFIDNAWDVLLAKAPGQTKTRTDWKPPGWKPTGVPMKMDTCNYLPGTANWQGYIADGLAKLTNKTFYGVCNDFTWVVTSVLVTSKFTGKLFKQAPLLPKGTRVEAYGIIGTQEGKHMFTVVNRAATSDEADYRTWGLDCFVVDQWYALQTGTLPVKTLAQGPLYDTVFIDWWNATVPGTRPSKEPGKTLSNSFKSQMEFHAGDYPAS